MSGVNFSADLDLHVPFGMGKIIWAILHRTPGNDNETYANKKGLEVSVITE
jgi:hypothetical protein